jgi:hypothetical protein
MFAKELSSFTKEVEKLNEQQLVRNQELEDKINQLEKDFSISDLFAEAYHIVAEFRSTDVLLTKGIKLEELSKCVLAITENFNLKNSQNYKNTIDFANWTAGLGAYYQGLALLRMAFSKKIRRKFAFFPKAGESLKAFAENIDLYWGLITPDSRKTIKDFAELMMEVVYDFRSNRERWGIQNLTAKAQEETDIDMDIIQFHAGFILWRIGKLDSANKNSFLKLFSLFSLSKSSSETDESLRAIAYSMDLLIPGFYAWVGKIRIRIGGAEPDDTPYRYPGTIHSLAGIALVLPGYRIFTTYQGTHDPRQA